MSQVDPRERPRRRGVRARAARRRRARRRRAADRSAERRSSRYSASRSPSASAASRPDRSVPAAISRRACGEVVAAPDRQRRDQPAAREVQHAERAVVDVAAHDLALGRLGDPDPLRRRPVGQVGPEVRAPRRTAGASRASPPRRRGPARARPRSARSARGRRAGPSRTRTCRRPPRRRAPTSRGPPSTRRRRVSPSSSFAARASITSGIAPVPITTMSAGELAPGRGDHALDAVVALEPLEPVAADELDAVLAQQRAEERRRPSAPKCVESGASSSITIVQRLPERGQRRRDLAGDVGAADRARRARPPRRRRGSRRRCRACAGSGCPRAARRRRRSRRTLAPVAISATPYSTTSLVESVAVRAAVSSRITLVRDASSIERLAYQAASWNRQASRSCAPAR